MDANGVGNVSPYSYFNVMSHDPMMITIGWWLSRNLPSSCLGSYCSLCPAGKRSHGWLLARAEAVPQLEFAGHSYSKAKRESGHKDSLQNILDTG